MRKSILAVAAVAGLLTAPTLALAQGEGVAAGAATGAAAGAVVGGPVGAAVGGIAGAATGAAAESSARQQPEAVIVTSPPATGTVTSERTCTTDAAGNRTCTEVRR